MSYAPHKIEVESFDDTAESSAPEGRTIVEIALDSLYGHGTFLDSPQGTLDILCRCTSHQHRTRPSSYQCVSDNNQVKRWVRGERRSFL
jgi:hypothetical protein